MELRSIGPPPPKNPHFYKKARYRTVGNLSGAWGFRCVSPVNPLPLVSASQKPSLVHEPRLTDPPMLYKKVMGMAKSDAQITVRVTSEFKARLEAQAQKERRSVANLVYKVMEDYLVKEESQP